MSDITATTVTADGVAVNHPARVKGMYFVRAATAGSVKLRDGGSTGTLLLTVQPQPLVLVRTSTFNLHS